MLLHSNLLLSVSVGCCFTLVHKSHQLLTGCCWEIRQLLRPVSLNRTQSSSSWVERSYDSTEIIRACLNVHSSLYITPKIYGTPIGNYEIDAQLLTIITRVDRQGPWLWGCCVSLGMRHQETGAWQSVCEWYTRLSMCSVCVCVHKWFHKCMNVYTSVGVPTGPVKAIECVRLQCVCECTCMSSMSKDLSIRWCSSVSLQYLCVTLHPCGSICVWVVTDFICLRELTWLACSSWMPGRGCGLLDGHSSIC